MLVIDELSYRIGGRIVLDRVSASIPMRARVALVGRNGSGKTTLLRLIMGEIESDGGEARVPRGTHVATVAQEAPGGDRSLLDTVLAADVERTRLLEEAEHAVAPERIGEIHSRLGEIGAHAAPARAAGILHGLGFSSDEMARPCAEFSGGWRMRVALAATLFARPDVLLLDEPTNHLDFESVAWLEGYLARYQGAVVIVSHERGLLDKVADRILHLDDGKLRAYTGNYSAFERAVAERRKTESRVAASLAERRQRMEAFVERFRAKATKARQAQSRLKALARLAPAPPIVELSLPSFDFPDPGKLRSPVIVLEGAQVGYDGTPVLRGLDLSIDLDDRIAILGPNGNGKSTLMRLLADRLSASAGKVKVSSKLRVGYFAQHQLDELVPARTAYQHLLALEPETPESRLRGHLGRFGLGQDKANVAAANLSGGEKTKLAFALMSRAAPHVMLLDEPTNHLDIESRNALVEALCAYSGAVILVTHDAHLIELLADHLWLVAEGTCRAFDGDLDDYRRTMLAAHSASNSGGGPARSGDARREARRAAARIREASASLRRAVKVAEKDVERLSSELSRIEEGLARPDAYAGNTDNLEALLKRRGNVGKALAEAEGRWLEAHEALEGETSV
jgi:ATP-binding cassette subfamily F protein 3